MTAFGSMLRVALGLVLLAGCGAARFDASRAPAEVRRSYRVFEVRCSKCHGLGRPLNARIESMEHWRSYVARMRRMPGSGIGPEEAVEILRFLEYYTYEVRGIPKPEPSGSTEHDGAAHE